MGLAFAGFCGMTNETNGVSSAQTERLETRVYKIDDKTFGKNLKHLAGMKEGESKYQTLLRFFKQNGVEVIKGADSVFWDDTKGLYVRTTLSKQLKIERLVMAIQNNVQPSMIH